MTGSDLLARVHERLREAAGVATEPRVTVGDRALVVDLHHPDGGHLAGLAHRPDGDPASLLADGASPAELATWAVTAETRLERAVGIATLNALSTPRIDWRVGDPMAALPPHVDVVATVGLFQPALKKFDDVTVRVVERDPPAPESISSPAGVSVETYAPAACAAAFADADVCFVTGSVLIYGGIDRYLAALADASVSPVVLVGATASHVPGPAFDAGVDVVAGARVTAVDGVVTRISAGDCGTDLHDEGVEKVYVAREGTVRGLEL